MKVLVPFALAVVVAVPTTATAASPMAAMQYYVGTWSCIGGPLSKAPTKATATYTMDSGVLNGRVNVAPSGKTMQPFGVGFTTSWDAKNGRYVQTGNQSDAGWWVTAAKPFSGNTEQWMDVATYDGKLGHGVMVRTDRNSNTFTGYASTGKANFKVTCHRS